MTGVTPTPSLSLIEKIKMLHSVKLNEEKEKLNNNHDDGRELVHSESDTVSQEQALRYIAEIKPAVCSTFRPET